MFKCYLNDIKNKDILYLSDIPIDVRDINQYQVNIEITDDLQSVIAPTVMIGDIEIEIELDTTLNNGALVYVSKKGGFFENAIFLNYFGECELSVTFNDLRKSYIVEVNVTGYKAAVAKEILVFLSDNAEDILQTCYSKSRIGFSSKRGSERKVVKINVLEKTVASIEKLLTSFVLDKKYEIKHVLTHNSRKPLVVDESSISWLSENLDDVELADSNSYQLKINKKHYKVNIPNSVAFFDTDLKENRVLNRFTLTALEYLYNIKKTLLLQTKNKEVYPKEDYDDYVKFDQVIKGVINPILIGKLEKINGLIVRLKKINSFFSEILPVSNLKSAMPVQSKFSLRHKHYGMAFNEISSFYRASDADRKEPELLLGLRNLSQLFELACLYRVINYFNKISIQKSATWANQSYSWTGKNTNEINVLANEFLFENQYFEYTVLYEKRFFSLQVNNSSEQDGNLVRVDKNSNFYAPDFVVKVRNKSNDEYYFIILDAKFSRSYKMKNAKESDVPSTLQSTYNKYATNLRTYKEGSITNLTRYVGVLFGLSKDEGERKRVYMFNKAHDINGVAPMFPFAAADFISFSDHENEIDELLNLYIQR